ncbi:sensor histidine kinase [Pseudonocardia sp. ICBG601]|uniref:sensor histidine kinase n=1 Tax=Pseudonocardia sp. ICBG601 TaxID=2846759 RepID=UPI001CF671FC|nr:histidine kinase [Pseudonocardia sp. ICBG601]
MFVLTIEVGFPLSLLAWRLSLQHVSPDFAEYLPEIEHMLLWLTAPLAILICTTLYRLRSGLLPRRWAAPTLATQCAVTSLGSWTAPVGAIITILILIFSCTVLVVLPDPWALPVFGGGAAAGGVSTSLTTPWQIVLGPFLLTLLVGVSIRATIQMGEMAMALQRSRKLLAGLAVVQERVRVAQDLHDTLGQGLTTVGLRAELAARLMMNSPERAAVEIREIQHITERALDDIRHVARGNWQPVFDEELAAGTALLESCGIRCRVSIAGIPNKRIGQIGGWVLREGITNVLKHSSAQECLFEIDTYNDTFRMAIENDGVRRSGEAGGGLAGLTNRVEQVGGNLHFEVTQDGRFRLVVEVPVGGKHDPHTCS